MILTDESQAVAIYLDDLVPNPDNPRRDMGDITDLANSIAAQGLLQPLLVVSGEPAGMGRYVVVDGHRRLAALRSLDFDDEIPVRVVTLDRTGRLLAALTAGLHGRPLTPLDEAQAFQHLVDLGLTQRAIAEQVGCNQSHVSKRLLLIALPDTAKKALSDGTVNVREAERFARTGSVEPPKTAPLKADVKLLERDNETLRAEVVQLRDVAEKARAAVAEVRAQVTEDDPWMLMARRLALRLEHHAYCTDHAAADPSCPSCTDRSVFTEWASLAGYMPDPPSGEAVDLADIPLTDAPDMADPANYTVAPVEQPPPDEANAMFPPDAELDDAQARWETDHPHAADKQPWGTYTMSSDDRVIALIRKMGIPDKVRQVIMWERRHDNRPEVLVAAADRLFEIG